MDLRPAERLDELFQLGVVAACFLYCEVEGTKLVERDKEVVVVGWNEILGHKPVDLLRNHVLFLSGSDSFEQEIDRPALYDFTRNFRRMQEARRIRRKDPESPLRVPGS